MPFQLPAYRPLQLPTYMPAGGGPRRGISLGYIPQVQQIGSPLNAQRLADMFKNLQTPAPATPAAPAASGNGPLSMDQLRGLILGGTNPTMQRGRDPGGYTTSGREGSGSSSSARGGGFGF